MSLNAARRGPFDSTCALDEIVGGPELGAIPDARAAGAARAADAVEIEAFAFLVLVELVVTLGIPAIDDGIADALAPDVDAAAAQALAARGGRIQRDAVHAMRDAIVLPGHVVVALGHDARVDAGRFRRRGRGRVPRA